MDQFVDESEPKRSKEADDDECVVVSTAQSNFSMLSSLVASPNV